MVVPASMSDITPFKDVAVMVVDDDRRIGKLIHSVLRVFGFRDITVLENGQKAMDLLDQKHFELLVVDWQMRPVSGIDMTKAIRQNDDKKIRFMPVLMLTGRASAEDIKTARDAGVTEFLVKPFSVRSLKERILEIIDKPRDFVVTDTYIGPDRRRRQQGPPKGMRGRRKEDQIPEQ